MQAALKENLRAAQIDQGLNLLVHFVLAKGVGLGVVGLSLKGAKGAIGLTNIGIIDIAFDHISANSAGMQGLGSLFAHLEQIVRTAALVEFQRTVGGESFDGFGENGVEHRSAFSDYRDGFLFDIEVQRALVRYQI